MVSSKFERSRIFRAVENSTNYPGGNQGSSLPPVSSLSSEQISKIIIYGSQSDEMKLCVMLAQSITGAAGTSPQQADLRPDNSQSDEMKLCFTLRAIPLQQASLRIQYLAAEKLICAICFVICFVFDSLVALDDTEVYPGMYRMMSFEDCTIQKRRTV